MLTLLVGVASLKENRINQKLPQAPESVLKQVWTILNAAHEDEELYAEFDRWEAASDEDEAQIETMLATKGV
jgi:hypothetical protein